VAKPNDAYLNLRANYLFAEDPAADGEPSRACIATSA
jgi:hypothetical protein